MRPRLIVACQIFRKHSHRDLINNTLLNVSLDVAERVASVVIIGQRHEWNGYFTR